MADRYWVGGTGSWASSTTNWSTTSGGSGGASVPTATDNVYFDANSGGGTCTVSQSGRTCLNLSFRGFSGTSDYTGTLAQSGTASIQISGSLTFAPPASMSITYAASSITLNSSASVTITFNGQTFPVALIIAGTGTFTCQDIIRVGGALNITQGIFTTTYDIYANSIGSTTPGLTKTFNVTGSASIYFTGTGNLITINTTNLTWNADVDYYITNSTATSKTLSFQSTYSTTKNINFGGSGSGILSLNIGFGNPTLIVTNTGGASINLTQSSLFTSVIFQPGTTASINQTTASRILTVSKDLTFTSSQGTTTVAPSSSFTVTFTGASTGIANITLAGKTLSTATVTCTGASVFNFLDDLSAGALTLSGGGTATYNISGTVTLGGGTATGNLTLTTGTLNCNTNTFNIAGFSSSSTTNVRTLNLGSGNASWTITTNFGWVCANNGPMNFIGGSGSNNSIYFTDTTNTTLTVSSSYLIPFDNVYFNRGTSTGTINFALSGTSMPTYTNFIDYGTAAHTITFQSSRTYTFENLSFQSSAGNIVTLTTSGGTVCNFVKSTSGYFLFDYLNVINNSATPAQNVWYGGYNSTLTNAPGWVKKGLFARNLSICGVGGWS